VFRLGGLTLERDKPAEPKTDVSAAIQSMKNKTMEEIINKWTGELDRCSEQFKTQANDIRRWDGILVENGDKVRISRDFIDGRLPSCILLHWKRHKLKTASTLPCRTLRTPRQS
jgi:Nsp1-like C-terminal region